MRLTFSAIMLASTIHIASASDNVTVTLPTGIVSGECSSTKLKLTVAQNLSSSATVTIDNTTGLSGTVSGASISYESTGIDCEATFKVVDGSTTYTYSGIE